jgi:hypothetical protein
MTSEYHLQCMFDKGRIVSEQHFCRELLITSYYNHLSGSSSRYSDTIDKVFTWADGGGLFSPINYFKREFNPALLYNNIMAFLLKGRSIQVELKETVPEVKLVPWVIQYSELPSPYLMSISLLFLKGGFKYLTAYNQMFGNEISLDNIIITLLSCHWNDVHLKDNIYTAFYIYKISSKKTLTLVEFLEYLNRTKISPYNILRGPAEYTRDIMCTQYKLPEEKRLSHERFKFFIKKFAGVIKKNMVDNSYGNTFDMNFQCDSLLNQCIAPYFKGEELCMNIGEFEIGDDVDEEVTEELVAEDVSTW